MTNEKYRHEYKYLVTDIQMQLIKSRISCIMPLDRNADNGMYSIRSLYFDDYYNSCYYDNENGVDKREKYRIRIYDSSSDRISLERKYKERDKTLKTSCIIDRELADCLVNEVKGIYLENPSELQQDFLYMINSKNLKPAIIVEYDRIPYVYRDGNVRVTFDMNISSSNQLSMFFEDTIAKRPVMPKGLHLLEVKFDEFLPDFIHKALEIDNLERTSFSKYYLCRRIHI